MLTEIERFVNWLRRRNPNAHTWHDYRGDLKQFAAVVGDRPPEAVTFHDVDRFVAEQVGRGLQPPTVNRRLAALAALYTAAVKEWHQLPAADHVVRQVSRKKEDNERVRFLKDDERAALLKATATSPNPYIHLAVVLSLATGWRQSEIMGLTWDRVDPARGWLTLDTSKNGERRGVGVAGYALDLLREFAQVRRADTDLLFPPRQQGEIARSLHRLGIDTRLEMLPSPQGHDAFLVDFETFGNVVGGFFRAIATQDQENP